VAIALSNRRGIQIDECWHANRDGSGVWSQVGGCYGYRAECTLCPIDETFINTIHVIDLDS
jgi:hypothetical protein